MNQNGNHGACDYDVIVVGGGAAGLGGALSLARARRSVLVIDAGEPRNAPASGVHGYLTRDGMAPSELAAAGRAEVAGYGGEFADGTVVAAERLPDDGGFRLVRDDGTARTAHTASRLLVTTGLVDELPDVPGVAERWGTDVLHCPYCHGWEVRDRAIGVLATGPMAVHQALLWRQWSDDVTLFQHTAPALDSEEYEQLAARGITVVDGKVTALETAEQGGLDGVRLADGQVVPCRALAVAPRFTARSEVLRGLGLEPVEQEMRGQVLGTRIETGPGGATEVPGVWAAGNVTDLAGQVSGAAAAGAQAAGVINMSLIEEETRRSVAAARRRAGEHAHPEHPEHTGHPARHNEHPARPDEQSWDDWYAEHERVWSGAANAALVDEVDGLSPGRALDLGCGEGGDAVWLARQGWHVTAVDVSQVALDRAAGHAAEAGVGDRVDWQRHDLGVSFPEGTYDLVSAQFLHSRGELPREEILRRAAEAVAPGGILLIESHLGFPSWEDHSHEPDIRFPSPDEVVAELRLPDGEWELLRSAEHQRVQNDPEGQPVTRTDSTVKLRRHGRDR